MLVFLGFFQAAGKHGGLGVAGIRMDMLPADQIAPHRRIAALRVGMYFRQGIAAVSVPVCLNLGKRTPEIPGFVIAAGIMAVNHKIGIPARRISVGIIAVRRVPMNFQRLRAAHGNPFLNRRHLRIAGVRVGVLRDVTLLFQCDSRQNQRIGGTEYHHTGKRGHYPMPEALSFMHPRVFFRIPQNIIPHTSFTTLLISTRRSPAEARPGIRFFQQSAHRKCSRPRYCGNPLRWNDDRPYRSNGYPVPDKVT